MMYQVITLDVTECLSVPVCEEELEQSVTDDAAKQTFKYLFH